MALPEKNGQVEFHLSWIEKLANKNNTKMMRFLGTALPDDPVNEDKLPGNNETVDLLDMIESEREDNVEKNCNDEYPVYVSFLSLQLTKAAKYLYTGDSASARGYISKVEAYLGKLTGDHARMVGVMEYFVDCFKWWLAEMEPRKTGDNGSIKSVAQLQEQWKALQKDHKSQAVIVYLKGRLTMNVLPYDENWQRSFINKVVDLDPDYHIWWHFGQMTLKRIRCIYRGVQHDPRTNATSQREIDFCLNAFRLAPNLLISKFGKADILLSRLWETTRPHLFIPSDTVPLESVEDTWNECLELCNDALETVESLGISDLLKKILSRKAELLMRLTKDRECHKQGWTVLQESVQKYPQDAFLHHNIGKVYHFGISTDAGKGIFKDVCKAREHFIMALSLRQWNTYPCLKSYLSLFPSLPMPLPKKEALALILEYEPLIRTEFQRVQVRLWKGFLHFLYNPEDVTDSKKVACLHWVEVIRDFPEQQDFILDFSCKSGLQFFQKNARFGEKWPFPIFLETLQRELQNLKKISPAGEKSPTFLEALDKLLTETAKQIRGIAASPSLSGNAQTSWREPGNSGLLASALCRERRNSYNQTSSLADSDDNWRIRK